MNFFYDSQRTNYNILCADYIRSNTGVFHYFGNFSPILVILATD